LNREFDRTDEAWVYSIIENNRTSQNETWGFHHFLHNLYTVFPNILFFRILRLISYVVSSTIVARIAISIYEQNNKAKLVQTNKILVYTFAQLGTVLAFSWQPRYFSYNEMIALVLPLFYINYINLINSNKAKRSAYYVSFFASLLFFIKISTFVVIAILSIVLLVYFKIALEKLKYSLLGILSFIVLLIAIDFPTKQYISNNFNLIKLGTKFPDKYNTNIITYADKTFSFTKEQLQNYVNNFSRMLFNIPQSYFYQREQTIFRIIPNSFVFVFL
jgi:hypothetical protein